MGLFGKRIGKRLLPAVTILAAVFLAFGAGVFSAGPNGSAGFVVYAAGNAAASAEGPENLAVLRNADAETKDEWAATLPSFDGRDYDYITPEHNQGGLGICWAYAAIGAMEANILRDGIDPEVDRNTLDLDEMVAAYVRYNRDGTEDPLRLTTGDAYSSNDWRSSGGHAHDAFLAMSQGNSPVDQVTTEWDRDRAVKDAVAPSKYFVRSIVPVDSDRESIKRAILEYGSVTMEYKAPKTTTQTYLYYGDGSSLGHASLIVGWDDEVPKGLFWPDQPTSDGAWIVKNSWGPGGNFRNGTYCFYLAYDSDLGGNLYAVDMELEENYPNIYYYDGRISDNEIQYLTDAHAAVYEAKLSSATEKEQLTAVSFGIRNDRLTADIAIYKDPSVDPADICDPSNDPDSGILVAEKKGVYFEHSGFYTVDLDEPVDLEQGEYFSIVLTGRDERGNPLFPRYAAETEESVNDMTYYKNGDEWTCLKKANSSGGLSLRLRAITNTVPRGESLGNDLRYARIELSERLLMYEKGRRQIPGITVIFGGEILREERDYTVFVTGGEKPGRATIEIAGIGDYVGTRTAAYTVEKPDLPPGAIKGAITVYRNIERLHDVPLPENWKWKEGNITLVFGLSDFGYQMEYVGDDADCYKSTVCSVHIDRKKEDPPPEIDLSGAAVEIDGDYTYLGTPIVPRVRVTCGGTELVKGVDYELICSDNVNAGEAAVTVRGCGRYYGEVRRTFAIGKASWPKDRPRAAIEIGSNVVTLGSVPLDCEGWEWKTPNAEIAGESATAVAVYRGRDRDNYENTEMTIALVRSAKKDIGGCRFELESDSYLSDGTEKTPKVTVRDGDTVLRENEDYTLSYRDNVAAGTARVIVTGTGDYVGVKELAFEIRAADPTPDRETDGSDGSGGGSAGEDADGENGDEGADGSGDAENSEQGDDPEKEGRGDPVKVWLPVAGGVAASAALVGGIVFALRRARAR